MTDCMHDTTNPEKKKADAPSNVLVIDDQADIREAIKDILELIDVDVIAANNGQEGVKLFANFHDKIGLVLLDMQMPVMSGKETFWHIRALDADIPIILSSGYGTMEAAQLSENGTLELGKVFFLRKPYAIDTLLELVQAQL